MKQMTVKDKMQELVNTLSATIIDADNYNDEICYQRIMQIRNECNDVIDGLDAVLDAKMFDID